MSSRISENFIRLIHFSFLSLAILSFYLLKSIFNLGRDESYKIKKRLGARQADILLDLLGENMSLFLLSLFSAVALYILIQKLLHSVLVPLKVNLQNVLLLASIFLLSTVFEAFATWRRVKDA